MADDGYKAIRLRKEVAEELGKWREMWGEESLSEVVKRVMILAGRELGRIVEERERIRSQLRDE